MKIYCSGIGGIGLSAYAALQKAAGHTVMGSDRADSELLQDLKAQGIQIVLKQDGSGIPDDCDLFVYSEAIPDDSPERRRSRDLSIRSISYFTALGELSKPYRVIAVCGTHGKSSTTGMLARVLIDAGLDPTVVVGTKLPDLQGRNWRKGDSDLFLLEACEYRRSFHALHPSVVVMTTVDGDHFDAFSSMEAYREAFVEFLQRLPDDGNVVLHGEDPDAVFVASKAKRVIIDADQLPLPNLSIPGNHMRENAKLALATAKHLGIATDAALKSLRNYKGAWRRVEHIGDTVQGIPVIDDYGHHPREIQATLQAVEEQYPERKIVCVFQPHTHDRTIKLYDAFTRAFSRARLVIIPNIYEARRERDSAQVDVDTFVRDIAHASTVKTLNGKSLAETVKILGDGILEDSDVLLCMGAGDVTNLASKMISH